MDLRKLKTLIDLVSESGVAELEITEGDDRVKIVNRVGAAPVAGGEVVDEGDDEGSGGGAGVQTNRVVGIGGGADGAVALDADVLRDDVEGLAGLVLVGEGVVDADVVAIGVLAGGIDHDVAGVFGGLVEGELISKEVDGGGGVALDRRERGVVFLAAEGGAGDGDVFAVGGGVDLEVEGLFNGAGAVGQGLQLRHPNAEEDRLVGGDVLGEGERR